MSRISAEQIQEARRMRSFGATLKEIAARVGVSAVTVHTYTHDLESNPTATKDELVLSAFPWASTLTTEERTEFGQELANPPKGAKEQDITRRIWAWRVKAERRAS